MAKKKKRSTTEDESSSGSSASSSEDISREETATLKRRRSQARRNTSKKERSYSQGKEIIKLLCKQSKQVTESMEEMSKQMENLRAEMCESKEICKQLEKVNQEMRKQLTEILTGQQRKQWDLHTNGSSGDDSDAPRSQSNPVQPPRYRLVLKCGVTDTIVKGQLIDISVALVDGNDQTVENGPLASATVQLVVVNAEFNQHNNQHSWSREDFDINILKARQGNSAAVHIDQSLESIVSDGRFNLVQGVKCHSGSKIFRNSANKKVRLGVKVVSPTEERVLEGLSNAFFVRGHDRDRPNRHSNLSHNRSNTQRQALVDNSYQVQNGQMPYLQNSLSPNSTQTREIRLNTDTRLQLPFPGNTTMVSLGMMDINGEQQPRFLGKTPMLSAEPSTSQEQRASTQYQHFPHLPMTAQAAENNQIDELSPSALFGHLSNPNNMGNSHALVDDEVGMQFSMYPRVLPVQLLWDRPNVEPRKRRWNLFDKLITPPQEHFGSVSLASIQKSVVQTRQKSGVLIEPLEPDDMDEQRPLKRKRHGKYQLRFVNKVCGAYYTRDQIKADDGNLLKVCLFDENNTKITSGPLSSASVEVVPLHGDFNFDGQDYWTSEEFNRSIVCLCPPPGEEASSVLGGDRILVLACGEACLSDAFFQKTSFCARTGKFKMGVTLASAQDERVQEAISEPFRVMDNLVKELNAKDGPTQGFNPAAATLQFLRNTITEAIVSVSPAHKALWASFPPKSLGWWERSTPPYKLALTPKTHRCGTIPTAQLSRLCSNRHTDQQTRLEANQERIAANGSNTSTRLCFLNDLEPPVYTDENLTSQNLAAIKLAMFEGDKVVTSGALSKAKIEILVLRGDFSNKCQDNWTEDEFDKHIMQGRDGLDLVLGTVWLTKGMVELSQIRFRKGSCRKKVIMAARVCKSIKTSGRVQEAIMKPVKVLDRRSKPNEKSHPPRLDDNLYRLEEIARDGAYHNRLQEAQIHNVGDFLKALNEDSNKLRAILKMENQQNAWSKLTKHARECVLEDRKELKRYHSKEGNVVLFFNCVHVLIGAAFPLEYVACERFNTAQKALVNKWRWHAYEKLKDISPDFVMKGNIPEPISSSTDVAPSVLAVGASQQVFSANQLAPYQGTGATEYLVHDEHLIGQISPIANCGPTVPNNGPNTHYYQGTGTAENLPQGEHGTPYEIADSGPIVADPDYLNTLYCQDQGNPPHGQQQVIPPWTQNP